MIQSMLLRKKDSIAGRQQDFPGGNGCHMAVVGFPDASGE